MLLEFTIPEIVVQGRPRFVSKKGRTWAYYDTQTKRGRKLIMDICKEKYPHIEPTHAIFAVYIEVYFSSFKQKVDLDNVIKIILDALTGVVWKNDKDVFFIIAQKRVVPKCAPCIYVRIETERNAHEL